MSKQLLLATVGYPGTGKSTVAKHLTKTHGAEYYEGSSVVKAHAAANGVILGERSDYAAYHARMRDELGAACLAEAILASPEKRLIFSGLRAKPNFERFTDAGGVVVALVCPPEICVARTDSSDPKNPASVTEYLKNVRDVEDTQGPNGHHAAWIIERADYTIDSSKPLDQVLELAEAIADTHLAQ